MVQGEERVRASLDGTAGHGAEFLPTMLSNRIIKQVFEDSWVRNSFESVLMDTITQTFPKISGSIRMYGTTGNEGDPEATESRHTTTDLTLSMKTIIGQVPIQKKTLAYGITGMLNAFLQNISDYVSETEEDIFINGDTETTYSSNINGEYDPTNYPLGIQSRDPRLELDGLRKMARRTNAKTVNASGSSLSTVHVRSAFNQLGKYGKKKRNLLVIVSDSVECEVLGWTQLETLEKYGPKATILTGEIGKLYGTTVIGTSLIPDTLDENGVARNQSLGTSGNKTVVLVVNKMYPLIGNPRMSERRFKIQVKDKPEKDRIILIPIEDLAFEIQYDEGICQIINVRPGVNA
jgi:hypothetical protein